MKPNGSGYKDKIQTDEFAALAGERGVCVSPRDMHRAIVSLMEELEAVEWYNQRVNACKNTERKSLLQHNADEEKEHAAMVLEWIRRRDPAFDKELRKWLFTDKKLDH